MLRVKVKLQLFLVVVIIVFNSCIAVSTLNKIQRNYEAKVAEKGVITFADFPEFFNLEYPDPIKKVFDNIVLKNPKIEQDDFGLQISGTSQIHDKIANIVFGIRISLSGTIKYKVIIELPLTWKFSDSVPEFRALDALEITSAYFVLSNSLYEEERFDDVMQKGLNIYFTTKLTRGPLKQLAKLIPGTNVLILRGVIEKETRNSFFKVTIPVEITFSKHVKTKELTFGIAFEKGDVEDVVYKPRFHIMTGLEVAVPEQKDPVDFSVEINFGVTSGSLAGWMEGMWENAFGLKGFDIGDLAIEAGLDYALIGAGMPLTELGVRGTFALGSKSLEVALKGDVGEPVGDIVVLGDFKGGLSLDDLVDFAFSIADVGKKKKKKISAEQKKKIRKKVPNIGLDRVRLYAAPKTTEFAEKAYKRGIHVLTEATIFGEKALLEIQLGKRAIRGTGYLSDVKLGPFSITGAGPDQKKGTKDDGAIVGLNIDAYKPYFFVDGLIALDILGGISAETRVDISLDGIYAKMDVKLPGAFDALLEVSADRKTLSKAYFKGSFKESSLESFSQMLFDEAYNLLEKAEKEVVDEIKKTNKKISVLKEKIKKKKRKCKKWIVAACTKVTTLGTELAALETYKATLLKPGKAVIQEVEEGKKIKKLARKLARYQERAFSVEEITFEAYAKDFKKMKLPKVTLKGVFFDQKVMLKDFQLDLSDLSSDVREVVKKSLSEIK